MKNTKLVWRLGKLPTVDEVNSLVDKKIITQEEAREILFKSEIETERDKQSLESEIKFLREIIEKLSQGRNQIIEVIREVQSPYIKDEWTGPYVTWCNSSGTFNGSTCTRDGFSDIITF